MKKNSWLKYEFLKFDRSAFAHFNFRSFILLIAFVLFSCAAQKTGTSYDEDLSQNRPKFNAPADSAVKKQDPHAQAAALVPTKNVNKKVDMVLDSIDQINLTKKFVDGFTIQIYSGQKREEAMNVKQKMVTEANDLSSSLQYIQPKFRVTVGSYLTRIEAQRDLARLKKHFANAILIPEKVLIK